jgi:hypothetical protein
MADVFLSYAREDSARAEQVARGLEANGLDVFWDNEIPPGATWADHIEQKLSQCKALIVLWSADSTKSQWVREEARMGRDKGVLIPAMIDAVPAPFGFGEVQAADLSRWNGEAEHPQWQRLLNAVRQFTSAAPTQQPMGAPPRAQQGPTTAQPKKSFPTWAWAVGGAVTGVALLGAAGVMLRPPPQAPATQSIAQPVAAQPDYRAQILSRLYEVEQAFAAQGFQRMGDPTTGQLRQGEHFNMPATLEVGGEYRIIGVCDGDCGDLDLALYDENNNLISQDNLVDATPIVSASPQWTGGFTVQAVMHQCSVEPCYYALVVYSRGTQAPR